MLHSTLPRAFLAPGLKYLGGYYGEDVRPYPATSYIPLEEHYPRIAEQHVFSTWQSSRPVTPCPLDLSLKPPPTPLSPKIEDVADEEIVVDDADDQRRQELDHRRYFEEREDDIRINDEVKLHRQNEYDQELVQNNQRHSPIEDSPEKQRNLQENDQLQYFNNNTMTLVAQKYHLPNQKLLLTSPSHLHSIQSCHQQLLLATPQHHLHGIHAPMTPPSTPSPPQCPRKRPRDDEVSPPSTPRQPPATAEKTVPRPKKKHARKLKFDEDTSSPVSGTVILGPDEAVVTGDIDPAFNVVEVTEEARAELAKIENRLGPYQCRLCRCLHEDAFQLAQHRCSRIAHVEYRCPECDKRFSCPANLASHRRWHKPRLPSGENGTVAATGAEIACTRCEAKFTRQAALRKHVASQHPQANTNGAEDTLGAPGDELLGSTNVQLGVAPLMNELP